MNPQPVKAFASGGQWRVLSGAAANTTPPSAPRIASTSTSNDTLTAVLGAPLSSGGAPVSGYSLTAQPVAAGVARMVSGTGPSLMLTGLSPGLSYRLTATATNSVGTSPASAEVVITVGAASYAKPLAYNTGYPHGLSGDTRTPVTLTAVTAAQFTDIIQQTSGNATISNYDVTGSFALRRENMTFRNCRFNGVPETTSEAGLPMIYYGGSPIPTVVTFIDCEFAGNGVNQPNPAGPYTTGWAHSIPCNVNTQVHIRSNIWGFIDGLHCTTNSRFEACYIHDLTFFYSGAANTTHNDGFQFVGDSENFVMTGCNVDMTTSVDVNAIMQYNGGSNNLPRYGMTLDSNWFAGGGYYGISGAPVPSGENLGMVISNNRFGLQSGSEALWYGSTGWTDAMAQGAIVFYNNVWDATGTTSQGYAVVAGQAIPLPGEE